MSPCGTVSIFRGQRKYAGACRTQYEPSADGPRRSYVLPPLCNASLLGEPSTVVLVALLRASPNPHGGAFGRTSDVLKHTRDFLQRSPGLCPSQLHVVHDDPRLSAERNDRLGAHLHRFEGNASVLGNDRRWALFQTVLRRLPPPSWRCAYALDLTDTQVLCLPRCEESPQSLFFSGESCGILSKQWLWAHAARMRLSAEALWTVWPWWGNISRFIQRQSGATVNSGVVGGHRSKFEPFLDAVVASYLRLWGTPGANLLVSGTDQVVWNGVALSLPPEHVVRGYPFGPVTLPWQGKLLNGPSLPGNELCLAVQHPDPTNPAAACSNSSGCRGAWAEHHSAGRYHFSHKLPTWWQRMAAIAARRQQPQGARCPQAQPHEVSAGSRALTGR